MAEVVVLSGSEAGICSGAKAACGTDIDSGLNLRFCICASERLLVVDEGTGFCFAGCGSCSGIVET
jgi:hypothetical protein